VRTVKLGKVICHWFQKLIFDYVPTASESRAAKRHWHELTPYKSNLSMMHGQPTANLEQAPHLEWYQLTIHKGWSLTFMDGSFFCSPNISKILLNDKDVAQMAPILRSTSTRSVRWIITSACVMEHTGHYIFAPVCLGENDCEVFTSSLLYL
jgi:hypothetical protein